MYSRLKIFLLTTALLFITVCSSPAAKEPIQLTIPQSVIAEATRALLPMNIDTHSKSVDGDITIINISDLQLTNGHLACRLHLMGNNLALLTEIGGHEIRLKVGSIELDVTANAALRFDAKQQVLYIKPIVKNVQGNGTGPNAEIGKALIAMLNGREFPVELEKFEPLVAQTGVKTVTIDTRIVNIEAKPKLLRLSLQPIITSK